MELTNVPTAVAGVFVQATHWTGRASGRGSNVARWRYSFGPSICAVLSGVDDWRSGLSKIWQHIGWPSDC
jgi:hypothetical protein